MESLKVWPPAKPSITNIINRCSTSASWNAAALLYRSEMRSRFSWAGLSSNGSLRFIYKCVLVRDGRVSILATAREWRLQQWREFLGKCQWVCIEVKVLPCVCARTTAAWYGQKSWEILYLWFKIMHFMLSMHAKSEPLCRQKIKFKYWNNKKSHACSSMQSTYRILL